MKGLLNKEFRLVIHPLFYLLLLCGALLMIPQWPYLIALMYIFFIAVPNIFTNSKAQNDVGFSVLLPVRRKDIVKARVMSIAALELMQIVVAAVFGAINLAIYPWGNFLMEPNPAFFGFAFVMYGVFNVVFFPMFYKTAYKMGIPLIVAITAAVVFAVAAEMLVLQIPALRVLDGRTFNGAQFAALAGGAAAFVLLSAAAYRMSAKRFVHIDL